MERFDQLLSDAVGTFQSGEFQRAADKLGILLQQFDCDGYKLEYTHRMRGYCFQLLGDYARALAEFELSLAASPHSLLAMDRLAYLLATVPDDALRDGVRAKALSTVTASQPHELQWASMTILAAAEAELGAFDEAVAIYERALQMAPDADRAKRQGRVEQLRAGQPLRCSLEFDRANLCRITATY